MTFAIFISGYFFAVLGWAMFWAIQLTSQYIINLNIRKSIIDNISMFN